MSIYITFTNNNLDDLLKVFELVKYEYKKLGKDENDSSGEDSSLNNNNITTNDKNLKEISKILNSLAESTKKKKKK